MGVAIQNSKVNSIKIGETNNENFVLSRNNEKFILS